MPPQPGIVVGREAMLKLWVDAGFGSEQFGRLRCVVTRANLQPAVANYVLQSGDDSWKALALDVLHIEDGIITEVVTFPGLVFPRFALPLTIDVRAEDFTRMSETGFTSQLSKLDERFES